MMRVPSNRMLPGFSESDSIWSRPHVVLSVTTLSTVVLLFLNVQPSVVTVFELLVLLGWTSLILDGSFLARLAADRRAESICTFARSFDCRAVDTWIIRAVYATLQESLPSDGFPMRATDRLWNELRLDDEDVEDLADLIAERSCRTLGDAESNPFYSQMVTVRDLVLFFAHQQPSQAVPSNANPDPRRV